MRVSLVFLNVRYEKNVFKQVVYAHLRQRGYRNAHYVSAPFLGNKVVFCKLVLYVVCVSVGLIHLVNRYDDVNARRLRVVDSFDCLRHDTVVSGYNKDCDIGTLRASCSHCGERLVSGGVEERYISAVYVNSVRADVLCNAAGFSCRYARVADSVENGGLAVVNVSHYAYNGRAGYEILFVFGFFREEFVFDCYLDFLCDDRAHFVGDEVSGVVVDDLVYRSHNAHEHELLDAFRRGYFKSLRKLAYGDFVGDCNLERLFLRFFEVSLLELFHSEAFFVVFLARTAVFGALVLLLHLLLGGVSVVNLRGEVFESLVILGEVDGGGSGIDYSCVAGTLFLHAGFYFRLRFGCNGSSVASGVLVAAAEAVAVAVIVRLESVTVTVIAIVVLAVVIVAVIVVSGSGGSLIISGVIAVKGFSLSVLVIL